jgi:transposase
MNPSHTHLPSLESHYALLLGLAEPWAVSGVRLDTESQTLEIRVAERGASRFPCPECGAPSTLHDHAPERRWRHLDTMQFRTEIVARPPRVSCPEHGVGTASVPWAGAHSRWTLLFEAFAVDVLLGTSNVTRAMALLRVGWGQLHAIMERAVERGLAARAEEDVPHVGIDEKSFLRGHRYASVMTDIDRGRVLEVVRERTTEAARELIKKALTAVQLARVEAASVDMWGPFLEAWRGLSDAPVVHDRFHVSKYLGGAVDDVRRAEAKDLRRGGSELLTGARYIFLKNELDERERARFDELMGEGLKVGRAWALKEAFRRFWDYRYAGSARKFFVRWYFRATHSRLKPVIDVARMLRRHLDGLLSHCAHPISNAVTEGLNSKIQFVKAGARGFRNFANYRIAILFHCGKLSLKPL